MSINETPDEQFEVQAIYGAHTRRGLVEITVAGVTLVVPPIRARRMAAYLLEAAAASESDEAIIKVLETVGAPEEMIQQTIMAVRIEREVVAVRANREAFEMLAEDMEDEEED